MVEVFPRKIVGAFPDGQYVVVLEDADHRVAAMVCNAPYDKMIFSSKTICSTNGSLAIRPKSGIFKECMIVDREGVMSFACVGEKSVYDYGAGMSIHGSLQHGCKLRIDDGLIDKSDIKERLKRLEEEVGTLYPLPKLESTSQLRAACEFLRL